MSKTVGGHWANLPSHGCFAYLERGLGETPDACRALIEEMTKGLGLGPETLKISTKDGHLQWSKFAWKKIDAAVENGRRSVTFLVGEPSEVHLGGRITLRNMRDDAPPYIWLAAESTRWPEDRFVAVARSWFRIAATQCQVISGGIVAATSLLAAKNEVSLEYEGMSFEAVSVADALFTERIHRDNAWRTWNRIRRIYPVTLLGPAFASATNAELLRAAGARVEAVGHALLADGHAPMIPAWDPAYLAATIELRRVAWPVTIQNLADAEGLGHPERFEIANKFSVPSWEPSVADVGRELEHQRSAMRELVKRGPERPRVSGELSREGPELQPPAREPTPDPPPARTRKPKKLIDLF